MALTREDYVTQSVEDYLKDQLFTVRGYPADRVELLDSWTGEALGSPLAKNYVAVGYNFDDGGRQAEMGSDLIVRLYTIEFFVFGQTYTWGRNLAQGIKFALENDGVIPIVDVSDPARPQTDEVLTVISSSAQRQPIPNPAEWQKNVWTCSLRAEDYYSARYNV